MSLRIGDTAPNFQADTTEGRIDFHQLIGDKWAVLFSHPKQFTPVLFYPMTTGRNFDEVLRTLDSPQLTAKHRVATPANWKQGQDVITAGSVNDEEAKKLFPKGWKAPKPYLRITEPPK